MKLFASATAIGISILGCVAGCSSPPSDGYTPPPGSSGSSSTSQGGSGNSTSQGGTGNTSTTGGTASSQAGSGTTTAGTSSGGGSAAGTTGSGGTMGGGEGPCPAGVLGHCDMGATYPTYQGFTLSLVEDFPAPLDLDTDPILTWSDGSPVDGQTRFRKEQISFADGKMVITAQPPDGCAPQTGNAQCIAAGTSYAEPALNMSTGQVGKMGVWSGEVRTKYNNYRYGRYEAKYHAPANTGGFISTMFVFRTPKWTIWNEIDNELEPSISTSVAGNVVFGPQGYTGYPNNAAQNDAWSAMIAGGTYHVADEHTYAFVWTPTEIDWYLDNGTTPIQTFTGKAMDGIPTASAKIMMNLWVFAQPNPFGDAKTNQYPIKSEYEWFHFYKWDQETTYPCSPAPSCLPAADKANSQNNPSEMNYGM
ncbi:MAG TPA: family 16 glycosylhydrolase [Polyangiaceae bacterium]|nr:family 16 glycosylhydrolase [Polyangiaceae bacterium]